jgi:hypothetical protein
LSTVFTQRTNSQKGGLIHDCNAVLAHVVVSQWSQQTDDVQPFRDTSSVPKLGPEGYEPNRGPSDLDDVVPLRFAFVLCQLETQHITINDNHPLIHHNYLSSRLQHKTASNAI